MPVRLIITRHGETEYNAQGIYAGSIDVPLNEKGFSQAEALSKLPLLREAEIIVSSSLIRAVQTAVVVQREICRPLHVYPEFRERNIGAYEGLTREEAKRRYPALWAMNITSIPDKAPDGGETLLEVTDRVRYGLSQLLANYPDRTVLLVSHGYISREINRLANDWDYLRASEFFMENTQVREYLLPL